MVIVYKAVGSLCVVSCCLYCSKLMLLREKRNWEFWDDCIFAIEKIVHLGKRMELDNEEILLHLKKEKAAFSYMNFDNCADIRLYRLPCWVEKDLLLTVENFFFSVGTMNSQELEEFSIYCINKIKLVQKESYNRYEKAKQLYTQIGVIIALFLVILLL